MNSYYYNMEHTDKPYELLAYSIIKRAIQDFHNDKMKADVLSFLNSEWYKVLCDCDSKIIIDRLENGYYKKKL